MSDRKRKFAHTTLLRNPSPKKKQKMTPSLPIHLFWEDDFIFRSPIDNKLKPVNQFTKTEIDIILERA